MTGSIEDNTKKYQFLDSHVAKEPFIFDLLDEIGRYQREHLEGAISELATLDILKRSKNIKMPFTPARDKNITYLVNLLLKNYPEECRSVYSYVFSADPATKKLVIEERVEYTVLLPNTGFREVQSERDAASTASLLALVQRFRFFNLTRLQKSARNQAHLGEIIRAAVGKDIFLFKFFTIDRNNFENVEDYCFHRENYQAVVGSLAIDRLQAIISANAKHIMTRLKKYGILNTSFSDFRDAKVDYLLRILLEDIATFIGEKNLMEVKNFQSLRNCIREVDELMDPLQTITPDIIKHIRETGRCTAGELRGIFNELTEESLNKWVAENGPRFKILTLEDEKKELHLFDGAQMLARLTELHGQTILRQERFAALEASTQRRILGELHLFCSMGRALLASSDRALELLKSGENVQRVETILRDYDDYQKRLIMKKEMQKERQEPQRGRSIFGVIVDFIKSLFGGRRGKGVQRQTGPRASEGQAVRVIKDVRDLYARILKRQAKLIPLSDFIDITPENDVLIDSVIQELRDANKKIIIPIYNARDVLYPVRSQKYLIADMEYVLVDTEVSQSADAIRGFTDSLTGEKVKDEKITPQAIMTIEKYLLTIFRQKKMRRQ